MVKAELAGRHSHSTAVGIKVQVVQRSGKYMARGRYRGHQFGVVLGSDRESAERALRKVLVEFDDGTFVLPSERVGRRLKDRVVPKFTLRQLCSAYLADVRKRRGEGTTNDYQSRLTPAIDFAETHSHRSRWPLAANIDREFAIEYRAFLIQRPVTRNGKSGAPPRPMSARQVRNCLEMMRTLLNWAVRTDVRQIPADYVVPFDNELIGPKAVKDPLRPSTFPLETRTQLISAMDYWELLHLSILTILPLRFEDVAGLLISDVDWEHSMLVYETRCGGADFNKARIAARIPFPPTLAIVLKDCIGNRKAGPVFRSRRCWSGQKAASINVSSLEELERCFHQRLALAPPGKVLTEQDQKRQFRRMLYSMGGIREDEISKSFKKLFRQVLGESKRPYDLRGSVTQDLRDAGIGEDARHYLTEHAVPRGILNVYSGFNPTLEMDKHFRRIEPLLTAIEDRLTVVGSAQAGDRRIDHGV